VDRVECHVSDQQADRYSSKPFKAEPFQDSAERKQLAGNHRVGDGSVWESFNPFRLDETKLRSEVSAWEVMFEESKTLSG